MARIRSIKPEFWRDGKILRLSDSCALFFIGLWNFCDDEGKCSNDSLELTSNLFRFKSKHISRWIRILFDEGLITLSADFRWVLVTNWGHQKIDKPRLPKVRKSEIEWLPVRKPDLSTNARRMLEDESTIPRRKDKDLDRIGYGSDKDISIPSASAKPDKERKPKPSKFIPDESDKQLAIAWREFALEESPWKKDDASFSEQRFATAIAEVRAKTDLNPEGMKAVLDFITRDKFWRKNAISPNGLLRVGANDLRKIDTILTRMKPHTDLIRKAAENIANEPFEEGIPF